MARPDASEYAPYFETYIGKVPDGDILEILRSQAVEFADFLVSIGEERAGHRYEAGKWSVKEVIGHVVDTERIFGTRALAIARGERTPLPSFEQDDYVAQGDFDSRTLDGLLEEFIALRQSHLALFASFADDVWLRRGVAGGNESSVRGLVWIIAGHLIHHEKVLKERYL